MASKKTSNNDEINYTQFFKEVADDPVKIKILLGIMQDPNITAKELKKNFNIKGTRIYYYLKQFEEKKFILFWKKKLLRN